MVGSYVQTYLDGKSFIPHGPSNWKMNSLYWLKKFIDLIKGSTTNLGDISQHLLGTTVWWTKPTFLYCLLNSSTE